MSEAKASTGTHELASLHLLPPTMPGPTVGELMSQQPHHYENPEDDDSDDEEEEEDDDFVQRPRRKYDEEEDEDEEQRPGPSKRARYSPSGPNGYARASPPASAGPSHSYGGAGPSSYPQTRAPPPLPSSGSKPNLEHSILNVEPMDELIREIADFVHRHIANRTEHVEIEAKIGVLRDHTGARIQLPVAVETILSDIPGLRFESNMSPSQIGRAHV